MEYTTVNMPSLSVCVLLNVSVVLQARRTFDRALAALPITQHDRVWVLYLVRC
jgi:pre-mRNA-splicing factor SYF1